MSEVSCRWSSWVIDWMNAQEINPEVWTLGLPVEVEQLRDPDHRIDWALATLLCERLPRVIDGGLSHRAVGRRLGRAFFESLEPRTDLDLVHLYQEGIRDAFAIAMPGIPLEVESPAPGRIDLDFHLP